MQKFTAVPTLRREGRTFPSPQGIQKRTCVGTAQASWWSPGALQGCRQIVQVHIEHVIIANKSGDG